MCEPLLLANSYTHTLRPARSRASTLAKETRTDSRVFTATGLHGLAAWSAWSAWSAGLHSLGTVSRIFAASFQGGLPTRSVTRTYLADGFTRIARGAPWAGSVTGGEACGYPCSEKEGFTHPPFWRAPCFWGAKNVETARWVNLRARVLKAFSLLRFFVALDKEMTCRHAQWLIVIKKIANSSRPLRPKAPTRH